MMETALCLVSTTVGLPVLLAYLAYRAKTSQKPSARVKTLWLYPVKSCGGVEINEAEVTLMGLRYEGLIDRSFCLYRDDGRVNRMLSLKVAHGMSLIKPSVSNGALTLSAPDVDDLRIEYDEKHFRDKSLVVVKNCFEYQTVVDCGDRAAEWFAAVIKQNGVRLGYSGFYLREKMSKMFREQDMYGLQLLSEFCAPLHLVSEASLEDLRGRVDVQLPNVQFRQPIMVEGSGPYAEDNWRDIHIGSCRLYSVQLCDRCSIITNDPSSGKPHPKMQPLNTLKQYRMRSDGGGPAFGIKLGLLVPGGVIKVGDPVYTTPAK